MMHKNFPVNSFPLPQRKPSLVPELACTIRNMVNAIHRSVPLQSPHVFKTIPSWNRRLLDETASTRNLILLNESGLDAWICGQTVTALTIGRRNMSGMTTFECLRCVFNTSRDAISRFVTLMGALTRFKRVAFCLEARPLFSQSCSDSDRYLSTKRNQRADALREACAGDRESDR